MKTQIYQNNQTDFSFVFQFMRKNEDGNLIGMSIPADDVDFEIDFFANNGVCFKVSRITGVYNFCEKVNDSRLRVYISLSHCFLGEGPLYQKLWLRTPGNFWNGNTENICLPAHTGFWLWNGPSQSHEVLPQIEAVIAGAFHGKDGVSAFYHIHTKKNNESDADGIVPQWDFRTIIEGVSDNEVLTLAEPNKYRFCLMRFKKEAYESCRWRIPMLPYEQAKRTGRSVYSSISELDSWWPVTGRETPWFRNGRKLPDAVPMHLTDINSANRIRFCATRNLKMRIGVGLFAYTGRGGEGWTRVSNIAFITLYVDKFGNIRLKMEP